MLLYRRDDNIDFHLGGSRFSFLPTGDIFEFVYDDFLINGFQGSPKEGSMNNIWIRIYDETGVRAYPLLGILSQSEISKGKNSLRYRGDIDGISYTVTYFLAQEGLWFWKVDLVGDGKKIDLLYGQDIGVAAKGGVLTNELYMAQYLGHSIFSSERGFSICSRQNQDQGGRFPYLQQGMIEGKAIAYSTDGTQFFGLSYKKTQVPEALTKDLPSKNYQYEFSYTGLQTERIILKGEKTFAFYGLFKPNHEDAIESLEFMDEIRAGYENLKELKDDYEGISPVKVRGEFGKPYTSPEWNKGKVSKIYPRRKLEENHEGELLSFFTPDHAHVVLQNKELLVERPHGTIITSGLNTEKVDNNLITSTNYIYGLFNGQAVIGNTSFHKLLSTPRGILNILKNQGQRIYVKLEGKYRMLNLPAAYEMGMNYSRWYYELPEDTLMITSYTTLDRPHIVLEVKSIEGIAYDYIITNQLVMGENEFQYPVELEKIDHGNKVLRIQPYRESWTESPYPELHYDVMLPETEYTFSDDRIFFEDGNPRNGTLLTLDVRGKKSFELIIKGNLGKVEREFGEGYSFEEEKKKFEELYKKLNAGFHLEKDGVKKDRIEKLNEIAWWYSHNAMVHFAVPHGLEQPGGAAWGTRDVCQGPMEYFLMTQNHAMARSILLEIYAHQIYETREWPQWFMFDRYPINAGECHGDVVLWPLKSLGDYIKASGDYSILAESLPYINKEDGHRTDREETLLDHVKRAAGTIPERFLEGSALISYAGGDWDDTLQPANESMKEHLVSAWTVALAYQVIKQLGEVLTPVDAEYGGELKDMAENMKASFHELLIEDGVIAGFAHREDDGAFTYMLHPKDDTTGIRYRLLPMTRSIIAEMVDSAQAKRNMAIIDEHLKCPDGARLMDNPARYDGGVSHLFVRAEQAANVGREISLQYVHAHIRYIEALAKLGLGVEAWDALFEINPINIGEEVPNALIRQSNMYFSSSDGLFMDRYEYGENFSKLRDGSIPVKGGWRLYSSGPGIYLNQLISHILGIGFHKDGIIIDPVLPQEMDGLRFTYTCYGRETTFVYHILGKGDKIEITRKGETLRGKDVKNPYRRNGILIDKADFLKESGEIHIRIS